MTTPVHVTTKEMVACFTLSVILSCSDFPTFYLIYLYLGILTTCQHLGFLWTGLLQWCWQFWQLVTLVALLPGWLLLRDSQRFQVLAVLAAGHPDRPLPLKYPGNWFRAWPVCGPPACTLQKKVRNRCYNRKGDGHFGCVQQAHLCCYKWTCTRSIASPQHLHRLHDSTSRGPAKPVGWGSSRNRMDVD